MAADHTPARPEAQAAKSKSAVSAAEAVGAQSFPKAALHLKMARDQIGTADRLIPEAVGRDIGCGMAVEAYDGLAERVARPEVAAAVLADLARAVPSNRPSENASLGKCAGTQSIITPIPAL